MSVLLCPSPVVLDQSFPRSDEELRLVASALGELQACIENRSVRLILTESLRQIIDDVEWQGRAVNQYPLLAEIHRLFVQMFLQPHNGIIFVRFLEHQDSPPHPVPTSAANGPWIDLWQEELGQLLSIHNQTCDAGRCYIGIADERGFAGVLNVDNQPATHGEMRSFPLIGPDNFEVLSDHAYYYVSEDVVSKPISFSQAKSNCKLLGATAVLNPRNGSHYKVVFPNAPRPWTLDSNLREIPDRYLSELQEITGYEKCFVIAVLVSGRLPPRKLKLCRSRLCAVACGIEDCRGGRYNKQCPYV